MKVRVKTFYFVFTTLFVAFPVIGSPIVNVSVEPLALLVRELCSDQCEVNSLVPRGASEHSWQPGPKDVIRAKAAVASISVGLGFDEHWFKRMAVVPGSVLKLGEKLSPMTWWSDDMSGDHEEKSSTSKNSHHDHGAKHSSHDLDDHDHRSMSDDPHVWTDAGRMSQAIGLIAAHLSNLIPGSNVALSKRAKEISDRLTKLQLDADNRRKNWRTRPVVMFHDTAGYFARRFNLPVLSISSGSSGHDHSARTIANVARRFKGVNVAAVMVEKDDGAARSLARELKTKVKIVDFGAAQSYERWDDWYLQLVTSWEDVLK